MNEYLNYNDELQHYGVLGMKWGVRRGNTARAYEKASKKLTKLNNRVEKQQTKARKKMDRAERKENSFLASERSTNRAIRKAKTSEYNSARKMKKALAWYKSMESTFAKTDIKLTAKQQELGRRYIDTLNSRTTMRSIRH